MATFYVLPPRPLLGQFFTGHLQQLFPGIAWSPSAGTEMADTLAVVAARQPDVYVVYREELPPGESSARALADGFGAEPGDDIIEVRPGSKLGDWTARRWRLGEAA